MSDRPPSGAIRYLCIFMTDKYDLALQLRRNAKSIRSFSLLPFFGTSPSTKITSRRSFQQQVTQEYECSLSSHCRFSNSDSFEWSCRCIPPPPGPTFTSARYLFPSKDAGGKALGTFEGSVKERQVNAGGSGPTTCWLSLVQDGGRSA